jgi:hypothetical protein
VGSGRDCDVLLDSHRQETALVGTSDHFPDTI